jgi:hypothetical protein
MSSLRLNLDDVRFKDLVELGRSLIPTIAPGWTDHNIHDPGIMLMELAAWVADAQVYALSRTSHGERQAFGHLLGVELSGPLPARGLIWPIAAEATAQTPVSWASGTVVGPDKTAQNDRPQSPSFSPTNTIELSTARLTRVVSRSPGSAAVHDWTRSNSQQGATFQPFGEGADATALELTLEGTLISNDPATDAPISIGFELDAPAAPAAGEPACPIVHLAVTLRDPIGPWPISVISDTTRGLSQSGVLLVTPAPALAGTNGTFTLSIASAAGRFLLPPRVRRIALNVLPVEQMGRISETVSSFGTNTPGQIYTLQKTGLMHPLTDNTFSIWIGGTDNMLHQWNRVANLADADPETNVYAVDERAGRVLFGNGVNGRRPAVGAALRADYRVSAGARGNLPRGVQWTIEGVSGTFGVNSEPTSGGADAVDWTGLRTLARQHARSARAIVTSADLQDAALALTDLEVRRAQELPLAAAPRTLRGARVLVAVGPHDGDADAAAFEESALWLSDIRRRLRPRVPLGQRLDVLGPRLVDVHVIAQVTAAPRLNPDALRADIEAMLQKKLAITSAVGDPVWPFGRNLSTLDVKGWLHNVPGVARVTSVVLRTPAQAGDVDRVELGAIGLPRLLIDPGDITVDRSPVGGRA